LQFFPKLAAFNIGWHERPRRRIDSFIAPKGCLTRPGMANHSGSHADFYPASPNSKRGSVLAEPGFAENSFPHGQLRVYLFSKDGASRLRCYFLLLECVLLP
jgi:hypothetical protein